MSAQSRTRTGLLAAELASRNWNVFLAWSPVSMGYLHGFFEGSHERFLTLAVSNSDQVAMIAPSLSGAQATRHGIDNLRLWSDGQDPYALLRALADEWGFANGIVAIDMDTPAHMVLGIQSALPDAKVVIGEPAISALRRVKDEAEIDAMRRAGAIADQAFEAVKSQIRPGVSELDIHRLLEREMERLGGKPTFCTVAFGPGSAEPHHLSESTILKDGDIVLMDFGCDVDNYQSDITRVVCCGRATDEMKGVYDIVFRAHMAGREAIRAGVPCQEIDRAARAVIDAEGFGDKFFHRVGHGIGMQVHESPYMVEGNAEPLQAGECFSIEPGIYLEGKWGIRIENIVSATETGHVSMNKEPSPELLEVGA